MRIEEIFQIAGAIITSIGGATLILFSASSWLGKVWANRILEKDKLKYTAEFEKIKDELQKEREKNQLIFSVHFQEQFKIYNNLWQALAELKHGVDRLWNEATRPNLRIFIKSVQNAKRHIRNSAILIESEHYDKIMANLSTFDEYKLGKETLINGQSINNLSPTEIVVLVEGNRIHRDEITTFVEFMLKTMRKQISGK